MSLIGVLGGSLWYGPTFLVFYLVLIVGLAGVCWWYRKSVDQSQALPSLPIPQDLEPRQVAFLRGGIPELIRFEVVQLFAKGLLKESKPFLGTRKWELDEEAVNRAGLDPISSEVAKNYLTRRVPQQILKSDVGFRLEPHTRNWNAWARKESLLANDEDYTSFQFVVVSAALFVLALGAGKLFIALANGRDNIGFLLALMITSVFVFFFVGKRKRLSDRGQRYIRDLQVAFEWARRLPAGNAEVVNSALETNSRNLGYELPALAMGLFGVAALQNSAYGHVYQQFSQSANTGGCGSGCGSGTSCGGGGGGGCGGGGCGGCGG